MQIHVRRGGVLMASALALVALVATTPAAEAGLLGRDRTASSPSSGGAEWVLGGKRCQLIAMPKTLPVGVAERCAGVRPGAAFFSPGGRCTLNFMWKGNDGGTYMGTAGHCILGGTDVDEAKWRPGTGPVAVDSRRRPIGRFAYAVLSGDYDFALIRLDPGVAATASPEMCHFGGPVGLNNDPIAPLTTLSHVGRGTLTGAVLPARTQVAIDTSDPDVVVAIGAAAPGDSGSPVTGPDGRAVGVLVATGPSVGPVLATGIVLTTRLGPQLAQATRVTGVRYDLQTAGA